LKSSDLQNAFVDSWLTNFCSGWLTNRSMQCATIPLKPEQNLGIDLLQISLAKSDEL